MGLSRTEDLISAAESEGRGVAAFNLITLEHAEAIVSGAEKAARPVILQISQNAVRWHGDNLRPITSAARAVADQAGVPVALHLDHVDDVDLLQRAADAGSSSVMFDAGTLPYAQNVALTAKSAQWAHANGLWLEAELGYVGGKPDQPASAHATGVRTDPGEAATFVKETGVDALAVAVGSSHAMAAKTASLDRELIGRLRDAVPVPLVLHGSSGVPDDELRAGIAAGIVKVNVGTALNIAMTAAVRSILDAESTLVDPRGYLQPARLAMAEVVADMLMVING